MDMASSRSADPVLSTLSRRGRLDDALKLIDQMIRRRPQSGAAHFQRGCVLEALNREDEAFVSYEHAVRLDSNLAIAHVRRGVLLKRRGRIDEALSSYERAISVNRACGDAYYNRGILLAQIGRYEAAIKSYSVAISHGPRCATAYFNRGCTLADMGRWAEAEEDYSTAIGLRPDCAGMYINRAVARLIQGNFENGFADFEWRWKKWHAAALSDSSKVWTGARSISGRTILLFSEQGLGDTIQFCRYAIVLSRMGARVLLKVQEPLRALMSRLAGVEMVLNQDRRYPPHDFVCPLLSLPFALGTVVDSIPVRRPYVYSDPARVRVWSYRVRSGTKPCVALAWRGNPAHKRDAQRSMALRSIVPFLPRTHQYFALQRDLSGEETEIIKNNRHIKHVSCDLNDIAAICDCVDLVISADTSFAHLSCALGRPTWILLPYTADWRWLLDREDSPWYPTARLFRQSRPGDWPGVFRRVEAALRNAFPPIGVCA